MEEIFIARVNLTISGEIDVDEFREKLNWILSSACAKMEEWFPKHDLVGYEIEKITIIT